MRRISIPRVLLIPTDEIRMEFESEKNRTEVVKKLSRQYVREHTKCLNEVFKGHYRKTVLGKCISKFFNNRPRNIENSSFYITVYSEKPLSDQVAYAILASYRNESEYETHITKDVFVNYITWAYRDFKEIYDIKNRLRMYEYADDGSLIIVLDVDPEKLGFDPEVMKRTKIFNQKEESGKYKTVIKAYVDFEIVAISKKPLLIGEVREISLAHHLTQIWVDEGEEGATYEEFSSALKTTDFLRKIYNYEYQGNFLLIEIE